VRQKYRERSDLLLLSATYWALGAKPHEVDRSLVQHEMGHACEWETSMMLRLAPHLVGDYRGAASLPEVDRFRPAHRAWITKDLTEPGHIGLPQAASAEKGETLFRLFADDVTTFLERVIDYSGQGDAS
jgi:creatinine amidohydrolase